MAVGAPILLAELQQSSMPDTKLLRAACYWNNNLATSSGLHLQVAKDDGHLTVRHLRSSCVTGLMAAVWDIGYDMVSTAGSLPEVTLYIAQT